MKHLKIENIIPQSIINQLVDFFFNNENLHIKNQGGNFIKIDYPWKHSKHLLEPILKQYLNLTTSNGQNFFLHHTTNSLHVDCYKNIPMYTVDIPLYYSEPFVQTLIVFDQYIDWNKDTRTWTQFEKKGDYNINKKNNLIPFEDPDVIGLTDNKNTEKWFLNHIYDKNDGEWKKNQYDYFYGLTPNIYDLNIGDVILFDSNLIHTTGPLLVDHKLGVSIQFDGKLCENILNKN